VADTAPALRFLRAHGTTEMSKARVHVLVVDDSAVVRQVMTAILTPQPGMTVSVAADPLIARDKMRRARPDVILLDLEMPRMDGLTFLREIMSTDPTPVVVCSALTGPGTDAAMRALDEGAVEIITKPQLGVQDFLEESATRLVDAVRGAAEARLSHRVPRAHPAVVKRPPLAIHTAPADTLIAVGASTGGTEALRVLLEGLPETAPGIVVVQHMPEPFTAAFARRLDETCRMTVQEAKDGDAVAPGRVLIAPGDRHLAVHAFAGRYAVEVRNGPLVSRHRPSVDVLFRSVAQAAGGKAVGVLLTGMGDDGAAGLLEMKLAGAATIAQDESTSVVFGMPKEAIARGAVGEVLPLGGIAPAVRRMFRLRED
jgi:two-component system, chemotaxis family, protein-glutamate methylesterase/glutaminase